MRAAPSLTDDVRRRHDLRRINISYGLIRLRQHGLVEAVYVERDMPAVTLLGAPGPSGLSWTNAERLAAATTRGEVEAIIASFTPRLNRRSAPARHGREYRA